MKMLPPSSQSRYGEDVVNLAEWQLSDPERRQKWNNVLQTNRNGEKEMQKLWRGEKDFFQGHNIYYHRKTNFVLHFHISCLQFLLVQTATCLLSLSCEWLATHLAMLLPKQQSSTPALPKLFWSWNTFLTW